ncbi:MAG: glycosyltransferase family 2 protein [Paludibacteraceae bacterium]|nr:glycosyltransferase family 2 protein [Paludibacteraceae bacterium]
MISIITAIFNQLPMNRMFYDSIVKNTDSEFELIIVDNGSTDGSVEFFKSLGNNVRVIENDGNYSYPYCQNEGIKVAKGDVFAFLNNDILLSPHWDSRLMQVLGKDGYHILSLASNDRMATKEETTKLSRHWKHVKYPLQFLLGQRSISLKLMTKLCYGLNWEKFCEDVWNRHKLNLRIGFSGSAIIMDKQGLEIVGGEWDPRIYAADFDMFFQTMKLSKEGKDIKPLSIVGGIFHHHFRRLTFHEKFPPFKDNDTLININQKWPEEELNEYSALIKR